VPDRPSFGYAKGVCETCELAEHVAAAAARRHLTVAVAESLTGGLLSSRLAAAPAAADWYRGAVVAYSRTVKHRLLGVPPGPVVSRAAALAMAAGVARMLGSDVSAALTGVGGPEQQDGQPAGTVWLAVQHGGRGGATRYRFDETDPAAVCERATREALVALLAALESGAEPRR
jgi:nicotinamide-nucleotide amidase